jgi:pimeloyl-ACP methyl ester carboxylesterase
MKNLYFISGLGADERVFQYLDLKSYTINFVKWRTPLEKETIENYTARLKSQIDTDNPVIIGLSFGGFIAIELSKLIQTQKTILISSIKTKNELPYFLKLLNVSQIYKLIPAILLSKPALLNHWFFSVESESEKNLYKTMVKETDSELLKWSIDKILNWKNEVVINNVVHIHGAKDRIFPIRTTNPDYIVENGGHFMIVNRANEISNLLNKIIQ